jgi:NADH-quinone oxidoreductase subunit E
MSDKQFKHKLYVKKNNLVAFTESTLDRIKIIISHYPEGQHKSALIPILHIAQEELGGSLNVDIMDYVATLLGITPIEVYEVASFYSQFYLDPVGKYVIEVCQTGPCGICGADDMIDYWQEILQIKVGETTADGQFTIKTVECLGSCGTAPMLQCGADFYENLTLEKVDHLVENLRKDGERRVYTKSLKVSMD